MKILIKGAGDLATGIAAAFFRKGHQVVMTENRMPAYRAAAGGIFQNCL